jgi:TolA-binding protein
VAFADSLYVRGMYALAVQEYRSLLTNGVAGGQEDLVLYRLGECLRQTGDAVGAQSYYGQVVDRFPASPMRARAEFRKAEMLLNAGRYIDAVDALRALRDRKPPTDVLSSTLYYLGYAQQKLRIFGEAEESFRGVIAEFKDSPYVPYAQLGLGEVLGLAGRGDEARSWLEKAASNPPAPRVGAEALFLLADLAFREKDYKRSADACEKLLQRYPDDARATDIQLIAAWSYLHTGRLEQAAAVADRAMPSAPEAQQPEWLYLLGNAHRKLNQWQEARAAYDVLLEKFEKSPFAVAAEYEGALVAYELKDHARALALAGRIATTNDLFADAQWLMAQASVALDRGTEAMEHYRRVAEVSPDSDRGVASDFQIARLLQEGGDRAGASDLYRQLAAEHPKNGLAPDALLASAWCRRQLKQNEEAIKDWTRLAEQYPKYGALDQALYGQAQAEMDLGRDDDARETLNRLLRSYPKSPLAGEGHYLRGALMEKAGKYDVADYHYQAALARKPDTDLARRIQFRRVAVLQHQGKADEAARALQQLVGTPSEKDIPPELLDWLARWNLERGDAEGAERAAQALVNGSDLPSWRQIGCYLTGQALRQLSRAEDARAAYEKALAEKASTREGAEAALALGDVALSLKDWDAAEKNFAGAAERADGDALLDLRARSYFGLGQAAAARKAWDDAARYFLGVGVLFDDPKLTPQALWRAAEVFGEAGRDAEKESTLAELKKRYPDSEWAKK